MDEDGSLGEAWPRNSDVCEAVSKVPGATADKRGGRHGIFSSSRHGWSRLVLMGILRDGGTVVL